MGKVVADPWVERVVDAALAEFLKAPRNWPGKAQELDGTALAALTTSLRAKLIKSPAVINRARTARLRYCNTAYKNMVAYQQAGCFGFLKPAPILALAESLVAKLPTDLQPDELVIAAPRYSNLLVVLERIAEEQGITLGTAQAQRASQRQKQTQARKAKVQKAQKAVSRLQLIGERVLRYEQAMVANTPESRNTARLLFNELYGSLHGWLVANELGGALEKIDASSPAALQAFKRGYRKNAAGAWIVADAMCAPPIGLLQYDPAWDRSDPDAVALWLWRQTSHNLKIDTFLAAYADDEEGMVALRTILGEEGGKPTWALSGMAFDALVRLSDYQTGAIYKRMLRAEACLAKLQQGAKTLEEEVAQQEPYASAPRPFDMQTATALEALYLSELDRQFPHYALRVRAGARQIDDLRTLEAGTRYSSAGIIDTSTARDPWISGEMLSAFVNAKLQKWSNSDFSPLWQDAGQDFIQRLTDRDTTEVREDGTIVRTTSGSPFIPWELQVVEDEGFYRYRAWTGGMLLVDPGTTVEDLLRFKLPSEDTSAYLKRLQDVNEEFIWQQEDSAWTVTRKSTSYSMHNTAVRDIMDGAQPYSWTNGQMAPTQALLVPRFVPYAILSSKGSASSIGYAAWFQNVFVSAFRRGISTRARFFLGYLNNDYGVFDPSDRTSFTTLKKMFSHTGQGKEGRDNRLRMAGGLYSIPWPASLSWVGLAEAPPTTSDQQAAVADPVNSVYEGGLTSLDNSVLSNLQGSRKIKGEVRDFAQDASGALTKGTYTLGLLWRMTRPAADNNRRLGSFTPGTKDLRESMLEMEEKGGIPMPTPALRDLGGKLKKQRKLERIGLYSQLFDNAFKSYVRDTDGGADALAARYNANWVGYRAREYSAKGEFGTPSITPHVVRWKHKKGINLYDYQSDAVLRLDGQQGGLLAFDVGVGKTLTALAAVAYARQEGKARRVLAIVPNTIQRQWLQEFQNALPDYNVAILGQTFRAPTKVPKAGAAQRLYRQLSNKGKQKGTEGGWLWRAVRDYHLPRFKKAGIKWASQKDGEGWRAITSEAEGIASKLIIQGGKLRDLAPHVVPFLTAEEADREFPGLPGAYQKATREERDQRWIAFSEGQYDAMVCSEVDFANLALREETIRSHLEGSPALRSELINNSFSGRGGAGGELKQRLQRAKQALREWGKALEARSLGNPLTPADVRNWVLDVVFPAQRRGTWSAPGLKGQQGGQFRPPIISIPPDLNIPVATGQSIGDALSDFVDQSLEDIETLSGDFWEEALAEFATRWFGPNRDTPDEKAQLEYKKLLDMPLAYMVVDSQGRPLATQGEPNAFSFWGANNITPPQHRLIGDAGLAQWNTKPLELDPRALNGSRLVQYPTMARIKSFTFPDGVASGKRSYALINYAPGGRGVRAPYALPKVGWQGRPLGVVTAQDKCQQIVNILNSAAQLPGGFDAFDPVNQKFVKAQGPFSVAEVTSWNRRGGKAGATLRGAGLETKDKRDKLAERMSMLPKPYDTQESWDTPPKVYWEDLQCDCLIVDEAHKYKALFSPRERGGKVAYLQSGQSSKRAWAMEVRCSDVKGRNGRVMLLTATPAKTSPLEFYNVMQLVGAPGLGADHSVFSQFSIYTPEQFVSRFVQIQDTIIIDPDGSMRRGAAATAFINLDKEFSSIFARYANRKTVLDVPTLRGKRAAKGKGAVYKAGEVEVLLPNADLSGVSIGDRFQLETGNSKGGYRVQGFLGNGNGSTGVVLLPPPAKDSTNDAVLKGDNWSVFTEGRVPLGPPPAVVDVPLDAFQGIYYGALQRALAKMILEDKRRALVSIGGQDLLSTTKLKVYPAMSRLTLHPQLELYTFDVEVFDVEGTEEEAKTARAVGNPFAHGLALSMDPLIDPVDQLVKLNRQGFGPWAFFGAPAPTKSGEMAQKGGLTSKINVVSPAYNTVLAEALVLRSKLQAGTLTKAEEKRLGVIEAEFDPDKKMSARKAWARPFMKVSALDYIGSTARTREGRLRKPGGVENVITGTLDPKDTLNPSSPRLAALIDRVLARLLEDERTDANVTCGNIAFCGNLYVHAFTVVAWCRYYAITKLFQQWAAKRTARGFNPDAGPWIRTLEDYGLTALWQTTGAALRIALPEAAFTLTPTSVTGNNQHPETLLAVEIIEDILEQGAEGYVGEAAAYRRSGEDFELFNLFLDEDPDTQPLKDAFDGYYVEGANRIVTMNAKTAPTVSRQDVTDAFNGEYTIGEDGEPVATVEPRYALVVANEVAYEGVDLQQRTCAIHHLDLPWTPSDFIQRQGRGVRQGNLFEVVDSYVYLSRNTVDYFRLQALERKRAWLESALDAESPTFELAANEEELLQLACQSVHPDDVEAVCAAAAQKLAEIRREQMVKEFVPVKAALREVSRTAALAFRWNLTEAAPFYAVNQYKSFLQASKKLREPNTLNLLQPIVAEPQITRALQVAFLQGADPEDIPGSLTRLRPRSVTVSPAIEDPTVKHPDPVLLEGQFLTQVMAFDPTDNPSAYAAEVPNGGNPMLNVPGSQPVVIREDTQAAVFTGPLNSDEALYFAFGAMGLYVGKSVKLIYSSGLRDALKDRVWGLHVNPTVVTTGPGALHRWWKPLRLETSPAQGYDAAYGAPSMYEVNRVWSSRQPGTEWARATVNLALGKTGTTSYDTQTWNATGHSVRKVTASFDVSMRGRRDAEPLLVQIPYSPDVLEELMEAEVLRRTQYNRRELFNQGSYTVERIEKNYAYDVAEIFYATIFNLTPEYLVGYQMQDSEMKRAADNFKDFPYRTNSLLSRQTFRLNSFVWLSGVPEDWCNFYWDRAAARENLQALMCRYLLTRCYSVDSVDVWWDYAEQAAERALEEQGVGEALANDPDAPSGWMEQLSNAMSQLDPYDNETDLLVTQQAQAVKRKITAQDIVVRAEDSAMYVPFMVGSKPFIVTPKKLAAADEAMRRQLLCGLILKTMFAGVVEKLDPAVLQSSLAEAEKERDAALKALNSAGKALDKLEPEVFGDIDPDAAKREALQKTVEEANNTIGDTQTRIERYKTALLLIAGQTVSIVAPTFAGLQAWVEAVRVSTGAANPSKEIGTVGGREYQNTIQSHWGQAIGKENVPQSFGNNYYIGVFGGDSPWYTTYKAVAHQTLSSPAWGSAGNATQGRLFSAGREDTEEGEDE